jgi:hypothetical protein
MFIAMVKRYFFMAPTCPDRRGNGFPFFDVVFIKVAYGNDFGTGQAAKKFEVAASPRTYPNECGSDRFQFWCGVITHVLLGHWP